MLTRLLALLRCLPIFVVVASFCVALGGCAKRCRPGLQLADGKCIAMDQQADLSEMAVADGGAADGGDSDEKPAKRGSARTGNEADTVGDAGASEKPASGSGARDSGAPERSGSSGAMMAAPGSPSGSNCGDGVVQSPEICDPGSSVTPCPVACVDTNPCTEDVLTGSASSCSSECKHNPITVPIAADGCCPAGATPSTDGDCNPECVAAAEVCDGKDNDCDGNADEGVRNDCGGCAVLDEAPGARCSVGDGECEVSGMLECDGKEKTRCSATARQTTAEICDAKDNDCDGRVDEGATNACNGCDRLDHAPGEPCSVGMGACQGDGVYRCQGTEAVSCNASARAPTRETCDGEDNDCNGMVDDGVGQTWYQDCDGDGYAAEGTGMDSCSKPARVNGCDWTDRAPSTTATDCDDKNEVRHPGAGPGLPISRAGQTLPPPNDPAYDLDCDGELTRSGGPFATGKIKQGQLEFLDLCPESFMCSGGGPYCVLPFAFQGGAIVCGQPYRTSAPCFGEIDVYVQCQ